jgi:alanine-glyoxylate transaminase / serine-glyoxylate transaminase / serine-pyruvate transaminase
MPGRNFLFVPGPTNVPDRVMRAMMVAMEDHRSSKFPELTLWLFQEVKKVFKTDMGQVFIFPSSGTGAWEAALSNTLSPGDKVLAPRFGQFSHLWIELAQRIGLDVLIQEQEWGTGASPERIEEALRADRTRSIKAILEVHNETATGVTSDIAAVRRAMDAAPSSGNALCRLRQLACEHRFLHGQVAGGPCGYWVAEGLNASSWSRNCMR